MVIKIFEEALRAPIRLDVTLGIANLPSRATVMLLLFTEPLARAPAQ